MPISSPTSSSPQSPWKGLGLRIAAAAIMIPIALAITWAGGIWFISLVALIGIGAASEWSRIVFSGSKAQFVIHSIAVLIVTFVTLRYSFLSTIALAAFAWSISLLIAGGRRTKINLWTLMSVPYIALPMAAFVQLRLSPDHGFTAILWMFAVVWFSDTLAYAFGRTIGGAKLAPAISPNKTWAGLIGAIVGGALGGTLVAWFSGLTAMLPLMLLAGAFGVVGQIGDLYESAAKRRQGIKDSGSIIPGHGGILDRVDALLAVSVVALVIGIMRQGLENPATGLLVW